MFWKILMVTLALAATFTTVPPETDVAEVTVRLGEVK